MRIGNVDFPDECPLRCPGRKMPFEQGGLCSRCPIFNCKPFTMEGQEVRLVEPDEYREDWARAWKDWFENGMKGWPELRF